MTLWTIVHQAPLAMGFSRQEYWSELPCPPPGDLLNPGTEPTSLFPALADGFFITSATWEALKHLNLNVLDILLIIDVAARFHSMPISTSFQPVCRHLQRSTVHFHLVTHRVPKQLC